MKGPQMHASMTPSMYMSSVVRVTPELMFGPVNEKNAEQLRALNNAILPVRYADSFYKDVLKTPPSKCAPEHLWSETQHFGSAREARGRWRIAQLPPPLPCSLLSAPPCSGYCGAAASRASAAWVSPAQA